MRQSIFIILAFSLGVYVGRSIEKLDSEVKIEELQNMLEIAETVAKECDFLVMQTERVLHKLAEECR